MALSQYWLDVEELAGGSAGTANRLYLGVSSEQVVRAAGRAVLRRILRCDLSLVSAVIDLRCQCLSWARKDGGVARHLPSPV